MNIKFLVYVGIVSYCACIQGVNEAITKAISSSNLESLERILMPGSYFRLQDKKTYSSLAQEKTREMFKNLHSFGFTDIKYAVKGLLGSAAVLWSVEKFCKEASRAKPYLITPSPDNPISEETTLVPWLKRHVVPSLLKKDFSLLGHFLTKKSDFMVLSALTLYFGYKSIEKFCAVMDKDERYNAYIRALAVESLIAHVPVFEQFD